MSLKNNSIISDQLLAILCHDLSTPLTVLAFNLEILSKEEYSEIDLNQKRFIRCFSAVKKMITILEFVKEAHLLQLGKLKIETSPISLKKCWDQVLLDFE
ncbi:MAG: histidine kinase dimerization/phospho-acceptor domain-containing protein, partial [Bdellovibrionales bacterium]